MHELLSLQLLMATIEKKLNSNCYELIKLKVGQSNWSSVLCYNQTLSTLCFTGKNQWR